MYQPPEFPTPKTNDKTQNLASQVNCEAGYMQDKIASILAVI